MFHTFEGHSRVSELAIVAISLYQYSVDDPHNLQALLSEKIAVVGL